MQFEKQRTIPDPENFLYAYAFDANGFYTGPVKRQPHPFREGIHLIPAGSTSLRPAFKEGFRAKWNGSSWDLVDATEASKKEQSAANQAFEAKQTMIDEATKNLESIVQSFVQKHVNLEIDRLRKLFETFQEEIVSAAGDAAKSVHREMLEILDNETILTQTRIEVLKSNCEEFEKRIDSKIDENIRLMGDLGAKNALVEEEKKPGLLERIFG